MSKRSRASAALVGVLCLVLAALGWVSTGVFAVMPATVPPSASLTVDAADPAAASTSIKDAPLVIVLDTSGSMSEADEDGTIKLAGAQTALTQMLRARHPGEEIGLWTFPGRSSCSPGGFNVPTQPLNQRQMIDSVRNLTSAGETPTGAALRSVTDKLKVQGYTSATILLISDGLSNCETESPDPCQVAQDIVAEGFDLTVEAAGFQISAEGLEQLQCIADATGGKLYEARDGDQLGDVVEQATGTELTVAVLDAPTTVPAGMARRITVKVTNANEREVRDVQVSLSFAVPGVGRRVVPAALPPRYSLGNLPPGTEQRQTWLVTFGAGGTTGTARFKVLASGSNSQPVVVEGDIDVTDSRIQLGDAGELLSGLAGRRIAILGDSFSSGEGAGNYQAHTHGDGDGANDCHKSYDTYLYPLFASTDVELFACSGAITRYTESRHTNAVEEEQLDDLASTQRSGEPVAAAFMTIGGNDIGFADIIARCTFPLDSVDKSRFITSFGMALGEVIARYGLASLNLDRASRCADDDLFTKEALDSASSETFKESLKTTYRLVAEALNQEDSVRKQGGVAPLFILAYPQIFGDPKYTSRCTFFDGEEIAFANDLVETLDRTVEAAAAEVRAEGYRVLFVNATQDSFLPDHSACPRPGLGARVNSLDPGVAAQMIKDKVFGGDKPGQQYMHPNLLGYRAETNSLLSWSVTAQDERPENVTDWRQAPDFDLTDNVMDLIDLPSPQLPVVGPAVYDAAQRAWVSKPVDVRAGQRLAVQVMHAAPSSEVTVSVSSKRAVLGQMLVKADGTGSGVVRIPDWVAPGQHRLAAMGFTDSGNSSTASQAIDVSRAIPGWLLPIALLGGFLGVAALVLLLWARRVRLSATAG